jgi:hypothetical protein
VAQAPGCEGLILIIVEKFAFKIDPNKNNSDMNYGVTPVNPTLALLLEVEDR